jgi:hypothetical protein
MRKKAMLATSDAGYAEMAGRYDALMAEAQCKAVRWVWYTDYAIDPRPLHFYLSAYYWPPGRPLLRVPKRIASGRVLYALDDAGHPLLARELVRVGQHPVRYYDTFYRDLDNGMEILHFSYNRHEPIHYERFYTVSGHPAGSATTAAHGRDVRVFHCDSHGRLAEIGHEHGSEREPVGPWSKLVITYDQSGDVHEVWQESPADDRKQTYPPARR